MTSNLTTNVRNHGWGSQRFSGKANVDTRKLGSHLVILYSMYINYSDKWCQACHWDFYRIYLCVRIAPHVSLGSFANFLNKSSLPDGSKLDVASSIFIFLQKWELSLQNRIFDHLETNFYPQVRKAFFLKKVSSKLRYQPLHKIRHFVDSGCFLQKHSGAFPLTGGQ